MRIKGYGAHQVPSTSAGEWTINGSYDQSHYSWEGQQVKTFFIDRPQTPLPMAMARIADQPWPSFSLNMETLLIDKGRHCRLKRH